MKISWVEQFISNNGSQEEMLKSAEGDQCTVKDCNISCGPAGKVS